MVLRLGKIIVSISICLFLILVLPGWSYAGSLTAEIWEENNPDYQKILAMPFNRELADGSLDEQVFKKYIVQDYFFLQNFRKVYGILLAKAPDEEGTVFVQEAIRGVDEEIDHIHKVYFKKFNIKSKDIAEAVVIPTTELYNSYLIKTAVLESFEIGLIATLPCHWIYYRLGMDMKKASPGTRNKYQEWIDGYGAPSWEKSDAKRFVDLVERYLTETSPAAREKMKKTFATAVKLEYMFWDGVYRDLNWLPHRGRQ